MGLEHAEAGSTSAGKTTNWIQLLLWEDTPGRRSIARSRNVVCKVPALASQIKVQKGGLGAERQ